MKSLVLVLVMFGASGAVHASNVRYCNPERSKPCGNSCIQKSFTCTKAPGIAVAGIRPGAAKSTPVKK